MNNPYEEKLAQFIDDEIMYNAVKSILEAQFDLNNMKVPLDKKHDASNEIIGQFTKAWIIGKSRLEEGFKEIQKYKKEKVAEKDNNNPAV